MGKNAEKGPRAKTIVPREDSNALTFLSRIPLAITKLLKDKRYPLRKVTSIEFHNDASGCITIKYESENNSQHMVVHPEVLVNIAAPSDLEVQLAEKEAQLADLEKASEVRAQARVEALESSLTVTERGDEKVVIDSPVKPEETIPAASTQADVDHDNAFGGDQPAPEGN